MDFKRSRATAVEELETAVRASAAVSPRDPYVALLDCPGKPSTLGRFSFLCVDPLFVFVTRRSRCYGGPPGDLGPLPGRPFDALRAVLAAFPPAPPPADLGLPFSGGAIGYLGYELLYELEEVPDGGRDDLPVPDCQLLFCRTVLATDHLREQSWLLSQGLGDTPAEAEREAQAALAAARARFRGLPTLRDAAPGESRVAAACAERLRLRPRLEEAQLEPLGISPALTREEYLAVVADAREHILAGDVFEICTTQRFEVERPPAGYPLYEVLRTVNPQPFAAYLRMPGLEVMCSSPERFLRLERSGWAETRPIKGTRPRGRTPGEDAAHAAELAGSEKDQAENMMIVDLARNDLGRVCDFDSVTVPELGVLETHPFTHQLVSTIRGRLSPGKGPIELLRATFPGGSMTGAPKIEAMKLIDALEPVKRGVFSGAIGYLDFDGPLDLNIVIRTLVKTGERLSFHVGGAIVADSDPAEEYQETLDKAHGLVTAVEIARELEDAG